MNTRPINSSLARLALLALLLSGCAGMPSTGYAAALERWRSRPVSHYLLRVEEQIGRLACSQSVEVRHEQVVRLDHNSCPHVVWTVDWLLMFASGTSKSPFVCLRQVPDVGCVCRRDFELEVTYDQTLGYPHQIIQRPVAHVNWGATAAWFYLATRS
jgi:hypothetical protein